MHAGQSRPVISFAWQTEGYLAPAVAAHFGASGKRYADAIVCLILSKNLFAVLSGANLEVWNASRSFSRFLPHCQPFGPEYNGQNTLVSANTELALRYEQPSNLFSSVHHINLSAYVMEVWVISNNYMAAIVYFHPLKVFIIRFFIVILLFLLLHSKP